MVRPTIFHLFLDGVLNSPSTGKHSVVLTDIVFKSEPEKSFPPFFSQLVAFEFEGYFSSPNQTVFCHVFPLVDCRAGYQKLITTSAIKRSQ